MIDAAIFTVEILFFIVLIWFTLEGLAWVRRAWFPRKDMVPRHELEIAQAFIEHQKEEISALQTQWKHDQERIRILAENQSGKIAPQERHQVRAYTEWAKAVEEAVAEVKRKAEEEGGGPGG